MVASVRQSAGQRSHDAAVVCAIRARQSPSPSRRAAIYWKPPSTLGGVRGGNRKEPPYSIVAAPQYVILSGLAAHSANGTWDDGVRRCTPGMVRAAGASGTSR